MNNISNNESFNDIALRSESVEIARREGWIIPPAMKHYITKFFGNKKALLPEIAALIPKGVETIFDAFSGTGIVSWALKHSGYALESFPQFIYNNNCQNDCYQMDVLELLPQIQADLAYFDPPYTTTGSYESHYSFYDNMTLALSGSGDKIISPWGGRSRLQPYTYFGTRNSAITGIAKLFERSSHIRHILFSYNTTSGISPTEIETFARNAGRRVTMKPFDRPRPTRAITKTRTTQEVLMLCE